MSKIIILLGPTASGKSQIGLELISKNSNLKIINCDSKQIYKEIPIITAQPPLNEIKSYEYSLYGYKSIYDHFDVTNWIDDAYWEINNAINLNKIPFLIGGTGFYVKSLLNGIDLRQEYHGINYYFFLVSLWKRRFFSLFSIPCFELLSVPLNYIVTSL